MWCRCGKAYNERRDGLHVGGGGRSQGWREQTAASGDGSHRGRGRRGESTPARAGARPRKVWQARSSVAKVRSPAWRVAAWFTTTRVMVGAKLHVVLDTHRGQHETHLGGDRPTQALDLLGQPWRIAARERQQAVAQLQPDHVHPQRIADRLFGCDRHRCLVRHRDARVLVAQPGGAARKTGERHERQHRQARQQREHGRHSRGHRQRLRTAAELTDQGGIGGALHAALGHHDTGGGRDQQRGDLRHEAVAGGQRGEGRGCIGEGHAVPQQTDRQAT